MLSFGLFLYTQLQKKSDSFQLIPGSLLIWLRFKFGRRSWQTSPLKQSKWNLEWQSPKLDVPLAFILFQLIYIVQEAWVFRKSKPNRKYCFEIA